MLIRIATALLFFVSLSNVSAQLHFGVLAGGNLNYVHVKDASSGVSPDIESRFYYFAGVAGEYMFSEKWGAGLDVQYAVHGTGYDASERPNAIESFRRKNIDLIPRVSFRVLKNTDLLVGAYYSFLLHEAFKFEGVNTWVFPYYSIYSKTDVGLAPGLRYQIGRWSVQAQAQIGLKDISTVEYTDANGASFESTEQNRSFQLGIGYRIF